MRYGLPLPERLQKFNELLANKQANALTKYDVPAINGNVLREVYLVSVELPKYRLDNTRTLALQEQYIYDNGLDAGFFGDVESDKVQEVQHGFLRQLSKSPDKEKDLYSVFSKETQTEPLILTHDGFVISGNRRLSTYRELVDENYEKYKHFAEVRVVILPNMDEDKIDQIEDALEQKTDIKQPFGWVSRALGYRRRMKKSGYSDDRLAEITGQKSSVISSLVNKLELADRYLEFIGKPKDYKLVENDEFAFNKISAALNSKDKPGPTKKIAFEKMAFIAIKNKGNIANRMYDNIPIIFEVQAAIQTEIAREFEDDLAQASGPVQTNVTGLTLFTDPTVPIIKIMSNPANEEKIVEIVSDKIEEFLILERDKKKKSSVLDRVRKAGTLLVEANTIKGPNTDKKGIAAQVSSIEKELDKLKSWLQP